MVHLSESILGTVALCVLQVRPRSACLFASAIKRDERDEVREKPAWLYV